MVPLFWICGWNVGHGSAVRTSEEQNITPQKQKILMYSVILAIPLLFGSFIQVADSTKVSESKLRSIESKVNIIESQQDLRQGYYLDTLHSERMLYATFLTLLVGLGGLLGFGVFRWRIRQVENELKEEIKSIEQRIETEEKKRRKETDSIESRLYEDIKQIEKQTNDFKIEAMRDYSEIFNSIARYEKKIGSDIYNDDYIKYKLRSILNTLRSGENIESVRMYDFERILKSMRDMYKKENGFSDKVHEEIEYNVREIMEVGEEEVKKECYKLIEALDALEEFDMPLPF